jgi:transposase InsO family protein
MDTFGRRFGYSGRSSGRNGVCSTATVTRILRAHGVEPTGKTFLRAHWDLLASVDFTTVEVWTKRGLVTYELFFTELATRRVHFAGLTANPEEGWMVRVARNLTDAEEGFLRGKKFLLMDRDGKFSHAFRATLWQAGVEAVRLPPRSPNLNPNLERFMGSIKAECL